VSPLSLSLKIAPNTFKVYNVTNSQPISNNDAINTKKSATLHILHVFGATLEEQAEWGH
jgi:hypothetical protein